MTRLSGRVSRIVACVVLAFALAGCASFSRNDPLARTEVLRSSLPVAGAALAAGQFDVARRLYRSLDERFADAPEPSLGLGYLAFHERDFATAKRHFLKSARRASGVPAVKAEALLGAGRATLAASDTPGDRARARMHLRNARAAGPRTPSAAWIANALAVAAALDGDYARARTHHAEALRLSSGHPRIAANFVRTLVAAGRLDEAAKLHAERDSSGWAGDDGPALARLIEEARGRVRRDVPGSASHPVLALRLSAFDLPAVRTGARSAFVAASPLVLDLARWPGPLRAPQRDVAAVSPVPSAETRSASETGPVARAPVSQVPPTTSTVALGHSRRLRLEHGATAVLVSSPEVADVQLLSPDVLYVIGKRVGRTSVAVLVDGQQVEEQTVEVVLDLEPLRTVLADQPGLQKVRPRHLARGMVLTGEVPSAAAADRTLRLATSTLPEGVPIENELRIAAPQQVNLEVLIAEVQRSATESLGVNWEAIRTRAGDTFGFAIGRDITDLAGTVGDGEPAAGIGFIRDTGSTRVSGMIDALATAGLANVLARPNLTAVSGETASFFSGGEFPLPTGFEDGVIVFEYKKFGVLLDFVPTVADTGRIVLTVRPEVSEPSDARAIDVGVVTVPVINVRRAETTVEVGDGESIVIAGLFRNASNTTEAGVPGLKDVPLLGILFGKTSVRSDELELIVVVTARLVHADRAVARGRGPAEPVRRTDGYHH